MKKLLSITLAIILGIPAMAQIKQETSSEIKNVTVYLSGAEVTRMATVNVNPGMTDLVFTQLTTDINASTIQVSSTGDLVIMGAVFQLNYLSRKQEEAQVKILQDSVELMNLEIQKMTNSKNVNTGLQEILNKNQGVGGENVGVTIANLQAVFDYYQSKMAQLKSDWTTLDEQQKKLQEILNRINSQLVELNQKKNQPTGEIVVTVNAKAFTAANFTVSYLVNQAGWAPQYDIRCANINSPVMLTYKADVHQNTNEDWKSVRLTLSTSNPTVSASRPVLQPWYLYYYNPYSYNSDNNNANYNGNIQQMNAPVTMSEKMTVDNLTLDEDKKEKDSQTSAYYTTVTAQQLSVEFDIDIPYDIPSDNKTHKVSIQDYTVPAVYEYYAVPKLDNDAFLLARITDWSKLNLLSGNASIFFEGAYVGQSYINTVTTKDTLDLSLGRDKKIVIKRIKEKDFTKQKFIGNDVKQAFNFTITARNTKAENVTIKILDQFPISNNGDIKVSRDDDGGATVDDVTGKMTWVLTLKPGEEHKMKFSFTVQYPKSQSIEGL